MNRRIPWLGILVEGTTIVVSILLAFGIDRWRERSDREEREAVLLTALLEDLRLDSVDYAEFAENNERRTIAANLLTGLAVHPDSADRLLDEAAAAGLTPGTAVTVLAIPSRLETVLVSYEEMTATGASSVVVDPSLRRRIASYYALAWDRSDINAAIDPGVQRFFIRLESLGYSPSDGNAIPAEELLADPVIRAQIRNMRSVAWTAHFYGEELLGEATELIRDVEEHLGLRASRR